jgi:transcriptional regulator with XRE-family HTH domain
MRLMPNRFHRPRAVGAEMRGRVRAADLARRLGAAVRDSRLRRGRLRREVAAEAGISQNWVSMMERGQGAGASLETWAAVSAAIDEQFVAYLERAPGATLPRDHAHLKGQELVIRTATMGGWRPMPEAALDPTAYRSRSVDVQLERRDGCEIAVVEIWDWFDDVGAALRSLDGKVAAAGREEPEAGITTAGLWVVRATRRNRALVADLHALFAAKFPAPSAGWLRALRDPDAAMPVENGFVWADVGATRLFTARLRR